jgi:hypothetical protein
MSAIALTLGSRLKAGTTWVIVVIHFQRVPGPHGFAVRDPLSPSGFSGMCTSAEALAKSEAAPFVCAL